MEKALRPMCYKTRCFVNAVSASKVQRRYVYIIQALSMMSGVIMTCMSGMRPRLVGSIATAGVHTYVPAR